MSSREDLPRGEERELVLDRDRVYELNGDDSHTLAVVGRFRVVPEHDLDPDHDTLRHLRDEALVESVTLGGGERGLTLTKERRDLLEGYTLERDRGTAQAFHAGVSRPRDIDHDANLYGRPARRKLAYPADLRRYVNARDFDAAFEVGAALQRRELIARAAT